MPSRERVLTRSGHRGLECDLLHCCCADGVLIKTEKSLKYQLTIKRKAARNLRRYIGAIFGRSLLSSNQQLQKFAKQVRIGPHARSLKAHARAQKSPLVTSEVFERRRAQLRVARRALDRSMAVAPGSNVTTRPARLFVYGNLMPAATIISVASIFKNAPDDNVCCRSQHSDRPHTSMLLSIGYCEAARIGKERCFLGERCFFGIS
jgi:hypothetical protein